MKRCTFAAAVLSRRYAYVPKVWPPTCSKKGMAIEILQMDYHYIVLDDEPSATAAALAVLGAEGVSLAGLSEFPHGPGKTQLDLIAPDTAALTRKATDMGLTVSRAKTGFLIRGDGAPGPAIASVLEKLAGAHIRVTSLQAVSAGAGRFGALLWVKAPDVPEAAKAMGAAAAPWNDLVDETSEESFPASDAPSWALAGPE